MGLIHILNTEVSNKIAAGEVVERPQSIVKELVENSIDAGASVITVEIRDGGISYIRVTDNGCGMSGEDAKICFLRHATSKIATGEDLEEIYTLGFRGEALSSIGAVAKVKLYTKRREDKGGVCITCEGGEILSSSDAGAPNGTVIEVSDLFYNTPARLKFLKKPATEAGYITDIMSRFVLSRPGISFKLIRDGKEVIFSSGDSKLINSVYAVYGRDYAKNMLEVNYEFNGIRVTGLTGKGTLCRPNRNYESFFVNRRYVKSALMIRALEEAYKNQIMISKFPAAVLNIDIDAKTVDINVHPTKLECKFSNEAEIYQAVYHAAHSALYALPNVPEKISAQPQKTIEEEKAEAAVFSPQPERTEQRSLEDIYREKVRSLEKRVVASPINAANKPAMSGEPDAFSRIDYALERSKTINRKLKIKDPSIEEEKPEELKQTNENIFNEEYFRVIGQLFETYILVEKDERLLIIDQHAAHERLNYEELKRECEQEGIASQMMLEPVEISLAAPEAAVYSENAALFKELGFEADLNEDGIISISAVPGDISWSDTEPLFLELLTAVADNKNDIITEKKQRLLYTISCKAAIKANMKISEKEMEELARKVFRLKNINTCPHGRPIVISMTKKELEKDFKRIV